MAYNLAITEASAHVGKAGMERTKKLTIRLLLLYGGLAVSLHPAPQTSAAVGGLRLKVSGFCEQ